MVSIVKKIVDNDGEGDHMRPGTGVIEGDGGAWSRRHHPYFQTTKNLQITMPKKPLRFPSKKRWWDASASWLDFSGDSTLAVVGPERVTGGACRVQNRTPIRDPLSHEEE